MPKKVAILQSNYIPWKGYFDFINSVDVFVIYDIVQYTKNYWRNRNQIVVGSEPAWLTIPVHQKSLEQSINETSIADPRWAKKHWRTIEQNYRKSPGFSVFGDVIGEAILGLANEPLLSKVNLVMIRVLCEMMGINTTIKLSEDFDLPDDRMDRLIHICNTLEADEYVSGPAARVYLDEQRFLKENMRVSWYDYSGYQQYPQASEVFSHYVSILDLLFCTSSDYRDYMKSF